MEEVGLFPTQEYLQEVASRLDLAFDYDRNGLDIRDEARETLLQKDLPLLLIHLQQIVFLKEKAKRRVS